MARARTELVHCDVCGEDYAATYRRCPFCNGKGEPQEGYDDDEGFFEDEEDTSRSGGRRLAGSASRFSDLDPAKIAIYVLAALIILAVVCVLLSVLFGRGKGKDAAEDPSASAITSGAVGAAGAQEYDPLSQENAPPVESDPISNPNQGSTTQTSTSAKIYYAGKPVNGNFTISAQYPDPIQLTVQGGTAQSWRTENTSIATVSANGTVSAVANGTTKVICTLDGGGETSCEVIVKGFSSQGSSGQGSSGQNSSNAMLTYSGVKKDDITVAVNEAVTLKVQGGKAQSWSSQDTSIATVSAGGTITGVKKGETKVSCTLEDGTVLRCTVRVKGN